jgi:hypothetical protein
MVPDSKKYRALQQDPNEQWKNDESIQNLYPRQRWHSRGFLP